LKEKDAAACSVIGAEKIKDGAAKIKLAHASCTKAGYQHENGED
jgi:hypothetical protein